MHPIKVILAATATLAMSACGSRNNFLCEENASCNLSGGGMCVPAPSGNRWCAYPDPSCPEGGYRYSDQDVGDGLAGECVQGLADAGVDSPMSDAFIDAPPGQNRFDVAYVDEWRLGTSTTSMNVTGWLRIANLGAQTLDVSSMTITNVSDDHSQMDVAMTIDNVGPNALPPGFTSGYLAGGSSSLVVAKMNEPAEDPTVSLVRLSIPSVSPSGTWLIVNATATLTIGNGYAIVPLKITSSGTGSASTPYTARRVSSTAL